MGAKVIELNRPRSELAKPPEAVFALRWRIQARGGIQVTSGWTPTMEYPSITETMKEFEGKIVALFIDGTHLHKSERLTMFKIPGPALRKFSYKLMQPLSPGRTMVIGIEVEDVEGRKYLILRDGNAYVEEPTK